MFPHWSTTIRPSVCGDPTEAFCIPLGNPRQVRFVICCQSSTALFLLRSVAGGSSLLKPWHAEISISENKLSGEVVYGPDFLRSASSRRLTAWTMFTPPHGVGV